MEKIVLLIILICLNMLGLYLVAKNTGKQTKKKIQFDLDRKNNKYYNSLGNELKSIIGLIFLSLVIIGSVSFFYNKKNLFGFILGGFFLMSLFIHFGYRRRTLN